MQIRVVDFEILTRHYTAYQSGVNDIAEERKRFIDRLTPLRNEMESIIKLSNSALVVDVPTQKSRAERFQQLQEEGVEIDSQFQSSMKKMRDDLNIKIYNDLSKIISKWGEENSIDIITGKMEVVYSNPIFDVTNDILNVLKEMELFVDEMKKEGV